MGLFDFFEKKRENKRKRELVREAKEKLPELIKLRNKKYPKEWYEPKSVECEDGETRELLYDDWGIISCDCGKVKVEEIIPKEKIVYIKTTNTIGLQTFAIENLPRSFNKEIEKSKMFNSKGKKLNTKEIIALWDRARKEEDEFNDLRSEIDRLETILGEKFPRTKIRFNEKIPRSRNLKIINDSCFENKEGFSGLIDGVEYFDGCKEPITQEKTYYENGELKEEYHVNKNGKWHGSYKLYHPNKQLKVELSYTNGIQDDGEIISYHDNGKISRKATLLNGNFHSVYQEWYSNGNFKKLGNYLPNGKEIVVSEGYENGNLKEKAPEENILDNQNIIEMQTEPELTKEMIECIKTVIIPRCIRWGINSSEEYIKANEDYEVDNVDLFQDLWGMEFFSNTDEILKINRNNFADEDEYQEERERRFEEEFGVGEDQMTINLGMDYLEDNEW